MQLREVRAVDWTAPVMAGQADEAVGRVCIDTVHSETPLVLTSVTVALPPDIDTDLVERVTVLWSPADGARATAAKFGAVDRPEGRFEIAGRQPLAAGANHLWIAVTTRPDAAGRRVAATCSAVTFGEADRHEFSASRADQRVGALVRAAGQDDCHTYRIPGLVTTAAGTLLAVYDCRYRSSGDLPGDIDVGLSRSTDGGRTWEPRRIALDMGADPEFRFDGVGDPAILVDEKTGAVWIAATWSHGDRSWRGSGPGMTPDDTGQLLLTKSEDDGRTWSPPINITPQVKDPAWRFVLQGPGRGICTRDGTLVFAAQYRAADGPPHEGKPFSTILWSADRGAHWTIGTGARIDTTEAQVVQLGDGRLMLNCRDNRGGARSIFTTADLGASWTEHPTSRRALPEPVCMASLLRTEHETRGPILLFSNPATTQGRHHLTLKASLDEGLSWPAAYHLLYDQRPGYGYSCLSMVDGEHVGILYEGRGDLRFVRIPLAELVPR